MIKNIFPTPSDTSRALVRHILELIDSSNKEVFNIALSGGSTPALMFDIWADEFSDATPWQRIRFYWVDERCVEPEDSQSNYRMTREHLFNRVPVNPDNVFRIMGENNPEEEAERYSALVARQVPIVEGLPVFDVVLLGAGDDGHTSSIFPGQENLLMTEDVYAVGTHPTSRQQRVALTGQPIMHALNIIFLMTGASKAPILQSFADEADSGPATYIVHHSLREVEIFADKAAAE